MLFALASLTALRKRALMLMSPLPPLRAAMVISLMSLVKILPRLASSAPFLCLIVCHFECPDIILIPRKCGKEVWEKQAGNIARGRRNRKIVLLDELNHRAHDVV